MSQHQISQGYDPSPTGQLPPDFVPRDNLKTVSIPRYCLNWFTSIALINTARNQETCGLLLGKDKGERYVVTTLLIPKQHATSDTCTIDEEELVMQFTKKRSLITLGWV
jgi:STAM-binding protein